MAFCKKLFMSLTSPNVYRYVQINYSKSTLSEKQTNPIRHFIECYHDLSKNIIIALSGYNTCTINQQGQPECKISGAKTRQPYHDKYQQCSFGTDLTKIELYKDRRWLEAGNSEFRQKRNCTIGVEKKRR